MKRYWAIAWLTSVIIWSCQSKNETIEIGEITERTAEELEEMKMFAPTFSFESIDGVQIALEDWKGKFVYIDVWATWCGPCLRQIPAMKELEEKYRGQDLEVVSISVDSERDKDKWRKMINAREMKGVQLYAGQNSTFQQDYQIRSIPKFILIGKEGEIISQNPPRPMDHRTGELNKELTDVLDQLLMQ